MEGKTSETGNTSAANNAFCHEKTWKNILHVLVAQQLFFYWHKMRGDSDTT